jgi:hypothetical protein
MIFDPEAALRALQSWHTWMYASIPAIIFGALVFKQLVKETKDHPYRSLFGFLFALPIPIYLICFAAPPYGG